MEILKPILFNSIILTLCISCSYPSKSEKQFNTAQNYITLFYKDNDTLNLYKAKTILEQEPKEIKTINALLNIYIVLQEYHNAIALIDNKPDSLFYKPYQKEMYYNYLQSKTAKTVEERDKYKSSFYKKMEIYITQNPNDYQALYEYYFTIAVFDSKNTAIDIIDNDIKSNKNNKQFLTTIRDAINNTIDIK